MLKSIYSFFTDLFPNFLSFSSHSSSILQLNNKKIVSCVLAMSKINLNKLNKNFAHAALLLIDTESDVDDDYRGDGIIIEYGDYFPNMSEKESELVKKGNVIYRYGDKGGLRYYAINYKEFLNIFGNICYVSMDISSDNQMTFQYFIDTIAPTSDNIWIKENYKVSILNGIIGIGKDNRHCQTFAAKALSILKPKFMKNMINVTDDSRKTKKKIDIFPDIIKDELLKLT